MGGKRSARRRESRNWNPALQASDMWQRTEAAQEGRKKRADLG